MSFPVHVHDLAARLIAARRLPGLAAAAFDADQTECMVHGFRDLSSKTPMTPDTRFPVASVTKTFTADLILRAAAAGAIDLDIPMAVQLPGFRLADPVAARTLTPRDALCHFSGLPPHTWAWVYGDFTREQLVRERLPHLASTGPHRAEHRYSNLLYAVLGALWESACGQTWEQGLLALAERAELPDTGLLTADWAEHPLMAAPHRYSRDGWRRISPFVARLGHPAAPAGELFATVADLAHWGRCHFGIGDGRWTPHSRVSEDGGQGVPVDYGLGWRLDRAPGTLRAWHSGQCSGFTVLLSLLPEKQMGHVWAANGSGAADLLHAMDLSAKTGRPLTLPPAPAVSAPPDPEFRTANPCPLIPGVYEHPGYGRLTLMPEENGLRVIFGGRTGGPVEENPDGRLSFRLPVYGVRMEIHPKPGALAIPFEPQAPNILFRATENAEASFPWLGNP